MSGDLMFGRETTYATPVVTSRALEVTAETLDGTRDVESTTSTRWGSLSNRRRNRIAKPFKGAGDVTLNLSSKGMGLLWESAFGGTSTSTLTTTATVYQQVHKVGNPLKPLTLQKLAPAVNTDGSFTDKAYTFPGSTVTAWSVEVPQGGVASASFTFASRTVLTSVAAAVPAYPVNEHVYQFAGACIFKDAIVKPTADALASSANPLANVKSFTLNVDNSATTEGREFFCGQGLGAQPTGGIRAITGTVVAEFTNNSPFVDAFLADATMGLLVNLAAVEDPNEVVQFVIPQVDFSGELPKLGEPGQPIEMSMTFTAWEDSAGDTLIGVYRTYDTAL